ncbi:MAG: hypothetical protein KA313_02770 [Pseudarcicella sp.]|jgi:uncharacterized membrane protein|nr:hypothetical protein [Pseudarcicella sp.]MBP6410000.1 hypothetical protein [Pseudarcicella sp.]
MSIAEYFSVMLATAVKFFAGPILGLSLGLKWYETALSSILGMMITVSILSVIGPRMIHFFDKFRKKPIRIFSKRTRFMVKLYAKYGMMGIACFTPLAFTPIGGTIIALSLKVPSLKIFQYMLIFAIFWGVLITLFVYQFWNSIQPIIHSVTDKIF